MEKWFVLAVAAVVTNCCSGSPIDSLDLARASGKVNPPETDPSTLVSAIYDKHDVICSGFHIRNDYVITIASCVENKMEENLRVLSYVLIKTRQYSYTAKRQTFYVDEILYPPGREERPNFLSLAVLRLSTPPLLPVVTAALPPFNFFSRSPRVKGVVFKSTNKSPNVGVIDSNMKQCLSHRRSDGGYRDLFFCVRQDNRKPFSVAQVDVGAPAMGVFNNKFYVVGIANVPQGNKENHFYYSIFKDLQFLHGLITPIVFPPDFDVRFEGKGSPFSDSTLTQSDDFITDTDKWISPFDIWSSDDSSHNPPPKAVDILPSDDIIFNPSDHSLSDESTVSPFILSPTDMLVNPSGPGKLGSSKDNFQTSVDAFIFESSPAITSSLNLISASRVSPNDDN